MNKIKRYTFDEDRLIVKTLKERHLKKKSKKACFEELSKKLGRSPEAIDVHYYAYILKQDPSIYEEEECQDYNTNHGRTKHYTDEEDQFIHDTMKSRITTKIVCFTLIAKELNRSMESVMQRYYHHISNPNSPHYKGPSDVTITEEGISTNRVNSFVKVKSNTKKSAIWRNILRFFGLKR